MALEDRLKKEDILTKDILNIFPYFSAAYQKAAQLPRGQEGDAKAQTYMNAAFVKAYESLDPVTKSAIQPIYRAAMRNVNFATEAVQYCAELYQETIEETKCSDVIELVKKFGYKEKLPEFLNEYANESMKSISEKYKSLLENKDPKIISVMKSLLTLNGIITRKATDGLDDLITSDNLDNYAKAYEKAREKENKEQEEQEAA